MRMLHEGTLVRALHELPHGRDIYPYVRGFVKSKYLRMWGTQSQADRHFEKNYVRGAIGLLPVCPSVIRTRFPRRVPGGPAFGSLGWRALQLQQLAPNLAA